MGTALDQLVELLDVELLEVEPLDVERLEVNLFRGVSSEEDRQRVFGGQVAGQALVAAGRTVEPDRDVHSLHAYFLRPGDPDVPIVYEVAPLPPEEPAGVGGAGPGGGLHLHGRRGARRHRDPGRPHPPDGTGSIVMARS